MLTPDFPPGHGGIQLTVHRLVHHWPEVQWLVVTRRESRAAGRREGLMRLNIRAIAEAARFRPDIVLSAHIAVSLAARVVRRLAGVPYVQYVHGMEVCDHPEWARFALRGAAAVIAVSDYTASLIANFLAGCPLHKISPGVDFPMVPPAARWGRPLVLTVSRLAERYKGHDVMLRAFPLVRSRVPDVSWVIVGDGQLRAIYEGMARAFDLSDQVRFVGSVDDDERDRWLDRASVFAMPSRLSARGGGEGFGIAYLEAGAHRLPVVSGNVGGSAEAVLDGVTGVLVDPTDHVAVADALVDLLLDPHRAQALGRAGETRAQQFAWPEIARRVEHLLLDVAAARAA